jgi:hypothetical protein
MGQVLQAAGENVVFRMEVIASLQEPAGTAIRKVDQVIGRRRLQTMASQLLPPNEEAKLV